MIAPPTPDEKLLILLAGRTVRLCQVLEIHRGLWSCHAKLQCQVSQVTKVFCDVEVMVSCLLHPLAKPSLPTTLNVHATQRPVRERPGDGIRELAVSAVPADRRWHSVPLQVRFAEFCTFTGQVYCVMYLCRSALSHFVPVQVRFIAF